MFNAQLFAGTPHLRQVGLIDLTPCHRGGEVVRTPVGVEAAKQTVAGNGLTNAVKTRRRTLLLAKEHRQVFAGGVIQGDHQIPVCVGHPGVGRGVLVDHHAHQGLGIALLVVFALARCLGHQTGAL